MWYAFLLSCTDTDTQEKQTPKTETVVQTVNKEQMLVSTQPKRKAVGSIGGIPILPTPSILGAIDNDKVISLIESKEHDFQKCLAEDTRKEKPYGKISVYFTTDKDGKVTRAELRSSTLRHAPTEECALDILSSMQFPILKEGNKAVIIYPITFGKRG